MPAGVCFQDILDEKVAARWDSERPRDVIFGAAPRTAWAPACSWAAASPAGMASPRPDAAAHRAYVSSLETAPRPGAPRPPARVLSLAQRRALECLRGFGAVTLDESFTDDEVRSAFRSLALRFHPDRHPAVGDDDRRYLAEAFDRVTRAYRQLTSVAFVS